MYNKLLALWAIIKEKKTRHCRKFLRVESESAFLLKCHNTCPILIQVDSKLPKLEVKASRAIA